MPSLALFDFDGTVTTKDNFTLFVRYAVKGWRRRLCWILLFPLVAGYRFGLIPGSKVRKCVILVAFKGRTSAEVSQLGFQFGKDVMEASVRPPAVERMMWHKLRGDRVCVVSASLEIYLARWCQQRGFDLISSGLESNRGRLTGRYESGDCMGAEKASRVRQAYDLGRFQEIFAYGDTLEDCELLGLASRKFFRWEEITDLDRHLEALGTGDLDSNRRDVRSDDNRLNALVEQQSQI